MLLVVAASFLILGMVLSEIPLPSGSSPLDRAESAAKETRFCSLINDSTLLLMSPTVRLRFGSYTFSLSHGRSSDWRLDLDVNFMAFVSSVGLDQVHLGQLVVTVPDELLHPFRLGA